MALDISARMSLTLLLHVCKNVVNVLESIVTVTVDKCITAAGCVSLLQDCGKSCSSPMWFAAVRAHGITGVTWAFRCPDITCTPIREMTSTVTTVIIRY